MNRKTPQLNCWKLVLQRPTPFRRLNWGTWKHRLKMNGESFAGDGRQNALVGTCLMMCPEKERDMRASHGDIDSFERPQEGAPATLAVKKFARNVRLLLFTF